MRPCPMQLFTLRRSTSCEHLPSLCALNLPAQELPCRKPRQGLWNLSSTKLLVLKAVRLQGKAFSESLRKNAPADIVREFERASPVIFPGRNYRWLMKMQPLMPRRLVATHVAQAARKIRCRGNQTRSLRPSPTGHVYAS